MTTCPLTARKVGPQSAPPPHPPEAPRLFLENKANPRERTLPACFILQPENQQYSPGADGRL